VWTCGRVPAQWAWRDLPNIPSVCPTCGQSLVDERTRSRVLRAQAGTHRSIERKLRATITADVEAATRARNADERERLRARIDQLQRQVDTQSAYDRGAAHERDVCGTLTAAFPEDRVVREGRRGDVLHTVLDERGHEAGLILYECKNAGTWQSAWLQKFRSDACRRQIPYLVLVTRKLPAKERGLCVRDDIAPAVTPSVQNDANSPVGSCTHSPGAIRPPVAVVPNSCWPTVIGVAVAIDLPPSAKEDVGAASAASTSRVQTGIRRRKAGSFSTGVGYRAAGA
jgi:hypothetical protein